MTIKEKQKLIHDHLISQGYEYTKTDISSNLRYTKDNLLMVVGLNNLSMFSFTNISENDSTNRRISKVFTLTLSEYIDTHITGERDEKVI